MTYASSRLLLGIVVAASLGLLAAALFSDVARAQANVFENCSGNIVWNGKSYVCQQGGKR